MGKKIIIYLIIILNIISFIYFNFNPQEVIKYSNSSENIEIYRCISSLFIHSDIYHIFLNLFALYNLSYYFNVIEFVIIYFGSGIFGNLINSIVYNKLNISHYSIGASTAVMGILGGCIIYCIKNKEYFKNILPGMIFMAIINIIPIGQRIDYTAHLFGILIGFILGILLFMRPNLRRNKI